MAVIIVPTDKNTIQEAIDNAAENDEIKILAGTYVESVVIDKTLTIYGELASTTIVEGDIEKIGFKVKANNVNIYNLTIKTFNIGIFTENNNINIHDCNINQNNTSGIILGGENHLVENNNISNNTKGMILNCSNSVIRENEMKDNKFSAIENIESLFLNTSIEYNKIYNSGVGISIINKLSNENQIKYNTIHKCDQGLIINSSENNISYNNISYCGVFALNITGYSNSIIRNSVGNNTDGFIISGYNNNIEQNSLTQNVNIGITLIGVTLQTGQDPNILSKNVVTDNGTGISKLDMSKIEGDNNVYKNRNLDIVPDENMNIDEKIIEPDDKIFYMERFVRKQE